MMNRALGISLVLGDIVPFFLHHAEQREASRLFDPSLIRATHPLPINFLRRSSEVALYDLCRSLYASSHSY